MYTSRILIILIQQVHLEDGCQLKSRSKAKNRRALKDTEKTQVCQNLNYSSLPAISGNSSFIWAHAQDTSSPRRKRHRNAEKDDGEYHTKTTQAVVSTRTYILRGIPRNGCPAAQQSKCYYWRCFV